MFNNKNTAFVVTDPQVEFLKPKGAGYGLTKDILRKYGSVAKFENQTRPL